jgi:cellulose synthase/poly-beta-1,6-N-acetylglucosamine synthase-like glycosyltransferase
LRASVIIPAFNAQETVAGCLNALHAQTLPSSEWQVIIIDDGSTDATKQIVASFHWANLVSIPHQGAAAARNRGAERARGSILLFTDADCEPQTDWIATLLAAFDDPAVMGAKGTYRTRQRNQIARWVQLEYEEKYARMSRSRTIDFIDTNCAGYRREIFLANGGFDETLPVDEDQEFSFRMAERGHKMIFVPKAIVYHQHAADLRTYWDRKYRIGYWKVRVHTLHPNKILRDSHTPPTLKLQILFIFALAASLAAIPWLSFAWLGVIVASICFGICALPLCIFVARRDASMALVAPVLIFFRACALGTGLIAGIFGQIWRIFSKPRVH